MKPNEPDRNDEWSATEYVDRVSLVVVPAESQLDEESATEWHLTSLAAARVDAVWLEKKLEEYVRGIPGEGCCGGPHPPYIIQIKRGSVNWGASGATLAALLFVGGAVGSGLLGNAAYDLLKGLGRKVRGRLFDQEMMVPVSEDEAQRVAQQFIYNRYSIPPDLLTVRRIDSDLVNTTTEIEFVDHSEIVYLCKIYTPPEGGVAVGQISRTSTDGTPIIIKRPEGM